jgi:zinc protease
MNYRLHSPRRFAAAALMLLLITFPAQFVQAEAVKREPVANFVLDNGMEVVVIPDHRGPIVTHMVWYKVGSADEQPGKSGIAHFFEHLMFKGTKNHPSGELDALVSSIGGELNALTTYDYTAYHETVPPEALPTMMELEADRMRNLIIDDAAVATEREVIMEERRSRIDGDPQALLSEEVQPTLYRNHPYRQPVIGWMHEIEQLNSADAKAFYDRYYRPNNAVLVVAGDVTAESVRAMAEATYGKLERGEDLPPRVRPSEPPNDASRAVKMSDARVGIPSFGKYWLTPSRRTGDPGEAEALELLAEILGGGARSRLYQNLVVKDPVAAATGCQYDGDMLDETSFVVYGAPRSPEELGDLEQRVESEIARIRRDGVSAEELERAKNRLVRSTIFAQDKPSRLAYIYGAALATGATVEDVQEWPERIRAVTAAQVQSAALKYLDPQRMVTSYLLPAAETPN